MTFNSRRLNVDRVDEQAGLAAVFLDLDGVILDTAPIANDLLRTLASRHGATITDDDLEQLAGASAKQFWGYVKEAYSLPEDVQHYAASYDISVEIAAYDRSLLAPGIEEFIRDLHSAGVYVAVVTSATRRRATAAINLLSVADLIACVISADDVRLHKPDPEPYVKAAMSVGINVEHCMAIEDSPTGVLAATGAGMSVATFNGFSAEGKNVSGGDYRISDFRLETHTSLGSAHSRWLMAGGRT